MGIRVGTEVFCIKGTKSAWGKVTGIYDGSAQYHVEFPNVNYPESEVLITGTYVIPRNHILNYREPKSETSTD